MEQMPRNKRWDFCPGARFLSDDESGGPACWTWWARALVADVNTSHPETLRKSELPGNNKRHGFLVLEVPCVYRCHQGLPFWKSGNDWLLPISCVSSFREKQCLEICILPCGDPPTSGGESALSSHTLLLGIQHEAAQSRVSCPRREPRSLAFQDILPVSYTHLTLPTTT